MPQWLWAIGLVSIVVIWSIGFVMGARGANRRFISELQLHLNEGGSGQSFVDFARSGQLYEEETE